MTCAIGLLFGCAKTDGVGVSKEGETDFSDSITAVPEMEWVLPDLLMPISMAVGHGVMYISDIASHDVKAFDEDGKLVRVYGRQGIGPGEFQSPTDLLILEADTTLIVKDSYREISIFDRGGSFRNSFTLEAFSSPSGAMEIVSDSLLALGGFLPTQGFEGVMIHRFSRGGYRLGSFYPLSVVNQELQTLRVMGVLMDVTPAGTIVATQPTDYRLSLYGATGDSIKTIDPAAPYYRRPGPTPPANADDEIWMSWVEAFDAPRRVFAISDDLVVVSVWLGGKERDNYSLDFVNLTSGRLLKSMKTDERLMHADPRAGTLYTVRKPTEEPVAVLRRYSVADLLGSGDVTVL